MAGEQTLEMLRAFPFVALYRSNRMCLYQVHAPSSGSSVMNIYPKVLPVTSQKIKIKYFAASYLGSTAERSIVPVLSGGGNAKLALIRQASDARPIHLTIQYVATSNGQAAEAARKGRTASMEA